eukprot:m.208576 g.208576  ORF g.208576 m.208576 type:complete len:164 (+) comp39710_c0_seq4:922-1413(+)
MSEQDNLKHEKHHDEDEGDGATPTADAMADNILTPQEMSNRMRVEFAEVIAEPEGTESIPKIIQISDLVYTWTKNLVYKFLTLVIAIILSLVWGLVFALVAFLTVWMINPAARLYYIFLDITGRFYAAMIAAFVDPLNRSCGLVFSRILARHQKVEDTASTLV